ncbi:methylated-DNA--[protein]-cysteine S-methyltransferase [Leptospira congkakensis]|uniref:methylated-DNA--[protein]-cysteine S-methyltransferase n=1 Tax=Leptospira congkakensis TaxID=2484932 RepID=A0A4Z1ACY2_9LEPT|nr:methylated-DNA--[protein]-cysteine S-methyltransferase [Leptospira congkakensis]TGL95302.1 methylated-DNA--[protein]-cysteine S-methyltransferase [Leptospira congkakensis]TGL96384.1 methylated-DNA--[protein]-cysteine S-methyltransferase [Leptospira congkakensis]
MEHFEDQPSLDFLAERVSLSPFHFQKVFRTWAGVSPKEFLQFVTVTHAKRLLRESSVLDTTYSLGLSGTGRLHDLFVKLEAMTPGEYKRGGEGLVLQYEVFPSLFGDILLVSSERGIQSLQFIDSSDKGISESKAEFPSAVWKEGGNGEHQKLKDYFQRLVIPETPIPLYVYGTEFQLKVWRSLLKIPLGAVSTYGDIATSIGQTSAQRAVGTAIGKNPIAYLIPCHRVIQTSGLFGGYRWDPDRKRMIIAWEQARLIAPNNDLSNVSE